MEEKTESSEFSPHDQKEQKKLTRQQEREQEFEKLKRKKEQKSTIIKTALFLLAAALIIYFYYGYSHRERPFTASPVHWHAKLDIIICGKPYTDFLKLGSGQEHAGSPLLHTHGDGVIHIEGQPIKASDVVLGRFMKNFGYKFSGTELIDKKNGDLCSGKPGQVKMTVNSQESTEYENYIIKGTQNAEEQKIVLDFG